jgi:hypothetical protein
MLLEDRVTAERVAELAGLGVPKQATAMRAMAPLSDTRVAEWVDNLRGEGTGRQRTREWVGDWKTAGELDRAGVAPAAAAAYAQQGSATPQDVIAATGGVEQAESGPSASPAAANPSEEPASELEPTTSDAPHNQVASDGATASDPEADASAPGTPPPVTGPQHGSVVEPRDVEAVMPEIPRTWLEDEEDGAVDDAVTDADIPALMPPANGTRDAVVPAEFAMADRTTPDGYKDWLNSGGLDTVNPPETEVAAGGEVLALNALPSAEAVVDTFWLPSFVSAGREQEFPIF